MLMVIFGAGASYDSDAKRPVNGTQRGSRLPLTEHLIDEQYRPIANEYPASISVIDYVQQNLADGTPTSLEIILAQYAARADNSFACRQALTAFRFYLCSLITNATVEWLRETHGLTIYLSLLNLLLEWQESSGERVQLVTFNYDTLLENAAARVIPDWRINAFDDYISRPDWSLLKLHGSVGWSRVASLGDDPRSESNSVRALAATNTVNVEDLPLRAQSATSIISTDNGDVLFPAIAVPLANKTTFECEDIQMERFRSTVPEIRRLLVCGWRAAEAHVIQILQDIYPGFYLGIVTGSQPDLADVQRNLGDVFPRGKLVITQTEGMSAFAQNMKQQLAPLLVPW
ncbi:MAG: hypothetical protein WBV85_13305 [Solirubrobacteraceae bacterium]